VSVGGADVLFGQIFAFTFPAATMTIFVLFTVWPWGFFRNLGYSMDNEPASFVYFFGGMGFVFWMGTYSWVFDQNGEADPIFWGDL